MRACYAWATLIVSLSFTAQWRGVGVGGGEGPGRRRMRGTTRLLASRAFDCPDVSEGRRAMKPRHAFPRRRRVGEKSGRAIQGGNAPGMPLVFTCAVERLSKGVP